jgi:hypothetical protein
MGKNMNQKAWLEFERLDRKRQEESFEAEPPLTEEEKAAQQDDFEAFRDDKCLREVDTIFDRMFGVLR